MGALVGLLIAVALIGISVEYLNEQPWRWVIVIAVFVVLTLLILIWRRRILNERIKDAEAMAHNLRDLANGIEPITDTFLSLRTGEVLFYEIEDVELREYRSTGSSYKGGYGGANIGVAKGLSISLGGNKGQLEKNPEESTMIDSGTASFTNQRVIFAGPKHSREWDLSKIIGMDISEMGYVATPNVSNRSKVSALAGGTTLGITPGILFAIAVEYSKNGKSAAEETAGFYAEKMFEQAEEYWAKYANRLF